MTQNFYNNGTRLYNTVNQKNWIIFQSEYNKNIKDWTYLLVLSDNKDFVVLGKNTVITGAYISDKIKDNKIIKNYIV